MQNTQLDCRSAVCKVSKPHNTDPEKDWFFRTDEYICDLRTVDVLVRDGIEYALPGGHVKIGTALNRGMFLGVERNPGT